MSERIWTTAQTEAFSAENGDLLVCAAAGSGKTAVLTERIIRSICDEENPTDITSKLIVTFTKAAASELKAKIAAAISEKMASTSGGSRLRRQLLSLDRAQISTIDSFCLSVVTAHFAELGLPAAVRIGGDADIELMKSDVMEQTIDAAYASGDRDLIELFDNFTSLRDDKIGEKFIKIYQMLSSYPEGVDYLKNSADRYARIAESGLSDSVYGTLLADRVDRMLGHYLRIYSELVPIIQADGTSAKCVAFYTDELEKLERVAFAVDFDTKRRLVAEFKFESAPPNRSKTEAYVKIAEIRDGLKKDHEKLVRAISFEDSGEKVAAALSEKLCRSLWRFLSDFERRYADEKRRFSVIDFADAERMTHALFIKNGKPTALARSVAERYDQIYIDEYQDINRLQDEIFSAISRNNRFMVGDIKQSIYGFRGAVPDIFADYRRNFPDYDKTSCADCGKIFLSHNFRSDKHILDFANAVCNRLFACGKGIPYAPSEDALRFPETKTQGDEDEKKVEVTLIRPTEDISSDICEASYVADKIAEMIKNGRSPSDIAILLRNPGTGEESFRDELKKRGIPFESVESEDLLKFPEITLVTAILGAIDNPRRDFPLAGAMKSPMFGITLDDLIMLRRNDKTGCLYQSLQNAVASGTFEKGKVFLDFLNDCRSYAIDNPTDKIVRYVYEKTALPELVSGKNGGREAASRLRTFYELARSFEGSSFRGLHNFMRYLDDIESGEKAVVKSSPPAGGSFVHLMSIHKSKGLEFPVVFLCRTNGRVNMTDAQGDILNDKDLGFAPTLKVASKMAKFDPMPKRAVAMKIEDNTIEEELRVLYVALTRPKNELYVTACLPKPEEYVEKCFDDGKYFDFHTLSSQKCYMKWILSAVGKDSEFCDIVIADHSCALLDDQAVEFDIEDSSNEPITVDIEAIRKRLKYRYPYSAQSSLPTKASVSKLYPEYLDEDEQREVRYRFDAVPDFLRPDKKPSGSDIGTATHLFMQFCDFEAVTKNGAVAELARLVDRGFIDRSSAELARLDCIETFFASELCRQIRSSSRVYREYRFIVDMPAADFTSDAVLAEKFDGSTVLVQGVIDCFFVMPDGSIKLVDYKTDRLDTSAGIDTAVKVLVDEYKNQLTYYARAIKKLCGKDVGSASIYAFDIGREIPVYIN